MDLLTAAKAAIFDLDGTLVDSNEFHILAWAEALQRQDLSVPRDELRAQIGKGSEELLAALLPHLDEARKTRATEGHSEIFKARFLDLVRPMPGAQQLIEFLHARGVKVALASACDDAELGHYVRLLGVGPSIAARVCGDDVKKSKPHGETFHAALRELGLPPDVAFAVGDTPYDIQAARKAGLKTIALRSGGFPIDQLLAWKPAAVYVDGQHLLAELQAGGTSHAGVKETASL